MYLLKYALLNIFKNKKLYIPMLLMVAITMFMLMATFVMHRQIEASLDGISVGYVAVAVGMHPYISPDLDNVDSENAEFVLRRDNLMERLADVGSDFIIEYYGFRQFLFTGSDTLKPLESTSDTIFNPDVGFWHRFGGEQFTLIAYSDITLSTHFVTGDRVIIDGRVATNPKEANISEEVAKLNGISIGDIIELYLFRENPHYVSFEVVGLFRDFGDEITNELALMLPRVLDRQEGIEIVDSAIGQVNSVIVHSLSRNSISRNQILTAVRSSADISGFSPGYITMPDGRTIPVEPFDDGYDVLVFYLEDVEHISLFLALIDDYIDGKHFTKDSGDRWRVLSFIAGRTRDTVALFMYVVGLVSIVFCGLLCWFILKSRTYDIGVFRVLGLSKTGVMRLFALEVFFSCLIAFSIAVIAYFVLLNPLIGFVYDMQLSSAISNWDYFQGVDLGLMSEQLANFSFVIAGGFLPVAFGFVVITILLIIAGGVTWFFVMRNHPMKIMTRY